MHVRFAQVRRTDKATTSARSSGQASVSLVAVLAVVLLVLLITNVVARRAVNQASARNAADAIALAAVVGGPDAASHVAASNRAQDFAVATDESEAVASVRIGDMEAIAKAQLAEGELEAAPALVAVMTRAEQLTAHSIGYVVVTPDPYGVVGSASFSVDVEPEVLTSVLEVAAQLELCRPDLATYPNRFRFC